MRVTIGARIVDRMLMPIVSVTVLGFVIAVVSVVVRRTPVGRSLLLGIVGAWLGFAAGSIAGALVDVVLGTGWVLALAGHTAAFAAAAGLVVGQREGRSSAGDAGTPS
ncbi:hypothetical protein B0T36_07465 [Nocardia donostiensis]|uniref:hypothetical protein n=1 Tax=Nocardia donostiensis TaxID=1538463 RepID=UPI0009DB4ED4|nr:hypothetical protein [Nocardia donostiensis]OQS15800.1 hypothetical protein B0T36_07465 [Nocardia donostiensis]